MSWPKTAIPRSCLPAYSLKALLTHLHISCTTHSSSHGRVFNRSNPPTSARASPGCDDEDVVTVSAHSPLCVSTGRQGRLHSIPSIYDNALVLPQPRLPTHRARSTRS